MAQEAAQNQDLGDGIDYEDILVALAIDARQNPETFNAESLRETLEAAGLEEIWNEAGVIDGEDEDDDDDDDDEDEEVDGDDSVTDDDEDEEVEEGEGDEE